MTSYVAYNQNLDAFVKVKKLSSDVLRGFFDDLSDDLSTPGFQVQHFMDRVLNLCVEDYDSLLKRFMEHEGVNESLYDSVLEVYPMLTVETACNHHNLANAEVQKSKVPLKTRKQIEKVRKSIEKNLIGQTEAVDSVVDALKLQCAGFDSKSSLFFLGSTGVGKTELARLLSKYYLGSYSKLVKINCAEYANPHEYAKLVGSPPGYVGFTEKGLLSEKADKSSRWIILFDEIEKASSKLHNLLLALLDDGVIMDNHGSELDFSNSIIVFTSNIGIKDNVGKISLGFGEEVKSFAESSSDIMKAFKNEFSPEFINRIDRVIMFNQLSVEDAKKIARLQLKKLPIRVTKRLVDFAVSGGYSQEYGARNLQRFIKTEITIKLANKILEENTRYSEYKPVFTKGELSVEGYE